MKRISAFVLCIICLLTAVSLLLPAAGASSYLIGDADGDGKVTILDATAIQRRLAALPVASFYEKAADIDGGGLSILDATMIRRYLAGFGNPYHIGESVSDMPQPTFDEYELPVIP